MKQENDGILVYDASANETERRALVRDQSAVLQIVSALRRYRAASIELLNKRSEGHVDRHEVSLFCDKILEIEKDLEDYAG